MFLKSLAIVLSRIFFITLFFSACTEPTIPDSDAPEVDNPGPPLDLNLNSPPAQEPASNAAFSKQDTLPDFFSSKEKEKDRISVSGKPLLDANNPDYVDSVQGAEVSIEIKTP